MNPALSIGSKAKGVEYSIVAGTRCAVSVKLFDSFGNARPRGKDKVTLIQLAPVFENEPVGGEIALLPVGLGAYEYQGLVVHACSKNGDNAIETAGFVVLVNGQKVREDALIVDVLPSEVNLDKCVATVTPAGIVSRAGEKFEFDVVVRDSWSNLRNRTHDVVEVFEYNAVTKQQGDRWGEYEVASSGHGSYRVTARHTLARQTYFTYVVNGVSSFTANQVHLLTITPHDVNVGQCVITGEVTSTVGQYISQLISLRDEFGNVLSPHQTAALEIAVVNVKVLQADIDPAELKLSSRVSRVDHHPGLIYTHQLISTTEQAVHVALDLVIGTPLHPVPPPPPPRCWAGSDGSAGRRLAGPRRTAQGHRAPWAHAVRRTRAAHEKGGHEKSGRAELSAGPRKARRRWGAPLDKGFSLPRSQAKLSRHRPAVVYAVEVCGGGGRGCRAR